MCSKYAHWQGPRRPWWFIFGLPIILLFIAIGSLILMWLWNLLLPAIFGFKLITFWQSMGLLILSKILFGGIHRRPKPFYGHPRHWDRWKKWHEEEEETHEDSAGEEKTV